MTVQLPELPPYDPFAGHRVEDYRVDLLSRTDGVLETLDGVESFSTVMDSDGLITGVGQLQLQDTGQEIPWTARRVQPWVTVNGESWPLGVYLLSAPSTVHTATGRSWSVTLSDKLTVLDTDQVSETVSFAPGKLISEAATEVILASGETNVAVTPSTGTVAEPGLTWPIGTSRLTIVNELLGALNYDPLRADAYGVLYSGPSTDPAARAVSRRFVDGESAIHLADFEVQRDLATVPNRIICLWQASPDTPVQKAVVEDLDPNSPTSYPVRGRWVTVTYDNQEADSQATLDAIAAKYMREALAPLDTVVFQHAQVPLRLGDVVLFESGGVSVLGEVRRVEAGSGVGSLTTTTIRKVVTPSG